MDDLNPNIIPIYCLGNMGRKKYGIKIGGQVKIASHIGHGGTKFPLGKTGTIMQIFPSSVVVKIEGDDREFQVLKIEILKK